MNTHQESLTSGSRVFKTFGQCTLRMHCKRNRPLPQHWGHFPSPTLWSAFREGAILPGHPAPNALGACLGLLSPYELGPLHKQSQPPAHLSVFPLEKTKFSVWCTPPSLLNSALGLGPLLWSSLEGQLPHMLFDSLRFISVGTWRLSQYTEQRKTWKPGLNLTTYYGFR